MSLTTPPSVQKLQTALHEKAKGSPNFRFYALCAQVIAFGKPVAYVHGDSHYFRVDKPLLDSTGKRVTNFTRVEAFGDHQPTLGDVNWLKVNVGALQPRGVLVRAADCEPRSCSRAVRSLFKHREGRDEPRSGRRLGPVRRCIFSRSCNANVRPHT